MNRYFLQLYIFLALFGLTMPSHACEFDFTWQRSKEPVLRSSMFHIPLLNVGYEAASDPHAFQTPSGAWRMIYSADDSDQISIKLAKLSKNSVWEEGPVLLGPSTGQKQPRLKETAFYHLASSGEHQIYFIGYDDEETYLSEIYLAVSDNLEGPYSVISEPVVPRGVIADRDVYLITSPSVVEHEGALHIVFLGWNGFEDVTEVWSLGAISKDGGRTWAGFEEVDTPIGMEGQITRTPNGNYAAVRTGEYGEGEAIFIACGAHPFGPYAKQDAPILAQQGPPWEVDEITAPALAFDQTSQEPTLFYTGADHSKGWWIMSANPGSGTD